MMPLRLNVLNLLMQLWKECSAYLISLVFPSVCVHCRAPISKDVIANDQYSLAMASYLCKKCIIDFYPGQGIRCPRCGEALTEKKQTPTCHACEKYSNSFDKVRFVGQYQGTYKQLIHLYKFHNKRQLAKPFSVLLEQRLENCLKDFYPIDLIAPVPLHISRLRERGFNQSLLMLWEWQGDQSKIVPELLIRTRPTKSQVGLSREQRLNNLVSAFRHNSDFNVQGKRILLVDDVYTTGSTVHSCTLPLLKSGADAVNILTLARA